MNPLLIVGAVVLSCKGINSGSKSICGHPGDGFDLGTYFLHCDGCISISGYESCKSHRDSGKNHILDRGRKTNFHHRFEKRKIWTTKKVYIRENHSVLFGKIVKHSGNNGLRQYGGNGSPGKGSEFSIMLPLR